MNKHGNIKDLTGQVFGWLTVKSFRHSSGNSYWNCVCKCGKELIVSANYLRTKHRTSCGCKRKYDNRTHGESGKGRHRLYIIWGNMLQRCYNKNNTGFRLYGARGIGICESWKKYTKFKEWAMTNGYDEGLSIDRIDNNGNYEPSNCRWVTHKEQMNNIRTNHNITFNGVTKSTSEWGEIYNISTNQIKYRIKQGWAIEDVFTKPLRKCVRNKNAAS